MKWASVSELHQWKTVKHSPYNSTEIILHVKHGTYCINLSQQATKYNNKCAFTCKELRNYYLKLHLKQQMSGQMTIDAGRMINLMSEP